MKIIQHPFGLFDCSILWKIISWKLKILEQLEERYSETLDTLDRELSSLEKSLEEMLKNLVVITNE